MTHKFWWKRPDQFPLWPPLWIEARPTLKLSMRSRTRNNIRKHILRGPCGSGFYFAAEYWIKPDFGKVCGTATLMTFEHRACEIEIPGSRERARIQVGPVRARANGRGAT